MRIQLLCSAAVIAITTAIAGPASAADLPAPVVYKAPPQPAIYNWSGFYIGGHVGAGSPKFEFNTGVNSGFQTGVIGGLQLGFNAQSKNVVWGIEGDVSGAGIRAGQDNPIQAQVDLLASIRGRLGLAFDRVLVYGTGGVGYVNGSAEANTLSTLVRTNLSSVRGVVGVGVEWAANDTLRLRVEALDYLGNTGFGLGGDLGNNIADIWVARVGASFRY
ncbi:MAG: outer membrane protein [Steroidobacteraceae bacterium]